MPNLLLNKGLCDYVTCTSYSREFWAAWKKLLHEVEAAEGFDPAESDAWYQYAGWKTTQPGYGELFVGSGLQGGENHFLLTSKGSIADSIYMKPQLEGSKCTRVDLQVTIEQPPDYDAVKMQEYARQYGLDPIYWPSADGEFVTLYFGRMEGSDNIFTRLYQKEKENGDKLLRLECVFRGKKAAACHHLLRGGKKPEGLIRSAMPAVPELLDIFDKYLVGEGIPVKIARTEHNTAAWLRRTVLPSFTRYINSHDADPDIIESFHNAIDRERKFR